MKTLASVGEFAFVDAIVKLAKAHAVDGVRIGVGDDAASVDCGPGTLLTVDCSVENVHFRRAWMSPGVLGRRAFRVAVSDIAAMGGKPRYVLLAFAAPGSLDFAYAKSVVRGLAADAARSGVALVGGNVTRADKISLGVTVIGESPTRVPRRSGARRGDAVWLTGTVGGAAAGAEILAGGGTETRLIAAYRTPPLRLNTAQSLAAAGLATAMIDVSDGVVQDLGHICEASGTRARIDPESLPLSAALRRAARAGVLKRKVASYALAGGEDYELLFTSADDADTERRIRRACQDTGCVVTRIGTMDAAAKKGPLVIAPGGDRLAGGFAHFGGRR